MKEIPFQITHEQILAAARGEDVTIIPAPPKGKIIQINYERNTYKIVDAPPPVKVTIND